MKEERHADSLRQRGRYRRVTLGKRVRRAKRRDGDAIERRPIRGSDLAARELGVGQDVSCGARATPVKTSAHPIAAIRVPPGGALVADGVDGEDGRPRGIQRRRVGGGVNQIDGGASSGPRKPYGGPPEVAWWVPRLGNVMDARR